MDPNNIEVEFVNDDEAADNNDWQSSSSSHVGTIVEADAHPSPIETDYAMKRSRSDIPTGDDDEPQASSAAARPLTRMNSIDKKALMFGLAALAAIIVISVGAGYMSSSKSNDTSKVSTAAMAAPWVEDSEGYAPYVTRQGPTSKGSKMMHGNIKEDNCSSGKSGKSNSTNTSGGGKSGKSNSRRLRHHRQLSGKSGGKSNKKTGCSTKSAKKSKGGSKGSKGGSKGSKGRRL